MSSSFEDEDKMQAQSQYQVRQYIFQALQFIQQTWLEIQTSINQGFANKGHLEKILAKLYGALFRHMYELHADMSQVDFNVLSELQSADESQGIESLKLAKANQDIRQILESDAELTIPSLTDLMSQVVRERQVKMLFELQFLREVINEGVKQSFKVFKSS